MSNMFKYENVVPNEDLPFRLFLFEGEEGNYKVEKHWHQSIEIFLVLQGHIDFYINSNYFLLEQGQFILVNSNEIHSIDALEKNKTIVLQIPRKIFEKYATDDVVLFKSTRYEKDTEVIQLIETMFANYKGKQIGRAHV